MKRILFFETPTFTGATRVTRTIAKKVSGHFEARTAVITNCGAQEKEIKKAIKEEQPNILFSSFTTINSDVIEVGKEFFLTVVVRQDYKLNDVEPAAKQRIIETYPKADWIIAQTLEMKQELLQSVPGINSKSIKVIENPLDEEDILIKASEPNPFPDNGNFHFLWVGRKDPIKDLPTLQKAFEIVHSDYPDTDLTLIYDEPNPYKWMKNADCLVISSISEASPNVLKEAMFLGTKVVSTDCSSSVIQLLSAKQICMILDPKDMAEKMAEVYKESNN